MSVDGEYEVVDERLGTWRVALGWDRLDDVLDEEPPARVFGRAQGLEFELPRAWSPATVDAYLDGLSAAPLELERITREVETAGHRVLRVWRRRGLTSH